jgi:hypothetical protein
MTSPGFDAAKRQPSGAESASLKPPLTRISHQGGVHRGSESSKVVVTQRLG